MNHAMSAGPPGRPGERIGSYEVIRYLTAGGMAGLFLVRAPDRREPLVLKRVQTRYLDKAKVVAMFLDEGQIGGMLKHPNVVRVHDVGHADRYIAMEYIPGHDLVEVLRRSTALRAVVPRELGVAICAQVARGLAYAHDLTDPAGSPLEIVHCDISPGNIMLSWRGAVKLVDFGVARARIPLHCQERGVAGKHNYMAPEQILGAPVDRRADLFALGIILYELTCGQRLFRGRPEVVMRQVVERPIPSPREVCPDYPADLEAIVMRALQRDPAQRYQTAEALRVDLSAFLARTAHPHGKRELARFLHRIFEREGEWEDGPDEEVHETVDLSDSEQRARLVRQVMTRDEDLTTEARAPDLPYEDREEGLLTRHDNPYLDPGAKVPLPGVVPRDPDRTSALRPPGRRRRRHSGGITTHMLGDGSTYPAMDSRPDSELTSTGLAPAGERAPVTASRRLGVRLRRLGRRRIAWLCAASALLLVLAYYFAQR